ncbi:aminotransferase class I/II-fold pyridoxal phosphate-dependent enzyme [Microbacterium gilvum]|uniref:aminotransferase class I/II-fold pyridoxal phosphate-dependent enzyme n=1 Tax=Microbacterium gilvum TaxID=1336204 RepID=UPI0031EE13C1
MSIDVWSSISGRTSQAIAEDLRELVDAGHLAAGTRLPTIRALASSLSVSPTTVSDAWGRLHASGVIRTEGRRGTFIAPRSGKRQISTTAGSILMDVAQGAADPELQPALQNAFTAALSGDTVNAHDFAYITDPLRSAVEEDWPYRPASWTTADGATDASALVLRALAPRARPVAVEQPTAQRTMALLRHHRRAQVGVSWDEEGPDPDQLRQAVVQRKAGMFYWQPRAHYPSGRSASPRRVRELADVLETHPDVVIVEDDMVGAASTAPAVSLARHLPDAVVRIRSFDVSHGLGLRTAVISGSNDAIRAVNMARGMLAVWNSPVLQNALAWLLTDADTRAFVQSAARRYEQRRRALVRSMDEAGLPLPAGEGLVLWVPVREEVAAVEHLTADGMIGGLGSVCWLDAVDRGHIRIPVGQTDLTRSQRERMAAALVSAVTA